MSRLAGEQVTGTAPESRSWLLIEQPGAWDSGIRDKVLERAFDASGLKKLKKLRKREGLRPLIIRRVAAPGARGTKEGKPKADRKREPTTVLIGYSTPEGGWLERREIGDLRELRDLDLEAIAAGRQGQADPVHSPALLVCTHGSKDMCCAISGRPVALSLATAYPDLTWEVSHVGGDRFAGNMLVAPYGLYYGHLDPATALRVAGEVLSGRVSLEAWRGRGLWEPAGQWADAELRRQLGATGLGDVVVDRVASRGKRAWSVSLRGPDDDRWTCLVADVDESVMNSSCAGKKTATAFVTESLARTSA